MTSPIRYAPNAARLAGRLEDELLHRGYALTRDDLGELRRLAAAEAAADAKLHLKARAQVERARAFHSGLMGQRSGQRSGQVGHRQARRHQAAATAVRFQHSHRNRDSTNGHT